jgi:hypothetical protein
MDIDLNKFRFPHQNYGLIIIAVVAAIGVLTIRLHADNKSADRAYPAASGHGGYGKSGKSYYPTGTIKGEALDEAKGGKTVRGTPVAPRTEYCFPAEPRDLFWQMDQVVWKKGGLEPLDFDENQDGVVDNSERDAIRGRNTWLLWGGGNEAFWGFLQEQGFGLTDFLILMDSRQRANRFKTAGLINQPGFETSKETILGLYLDKAKGENGRDALLRPPQPRDENGNVIWTPYKPNYGNRYDAEPEYYDAQGRKLENPVYRPTPPPNHYTELFEPWTTPAERAKAWEEENKGKPPAKDPWEDYVPQTVREKLSYDGLDPQVYGYPSGIFGLRLMLNPDFFAKTDAAAEARKYWKKQVEATNGRYYTDPGIHADPKLIRPFRPTMSCGFCHVAQHPLNPPVRDDEPEWENLSSIIGAQYWDPQPAFGNLLRRQSFLYHFLKSQAPGSVDTSLVSTDHINNTNVINPIFDVPSRLVRAMEKPTETQDFDNLLLPSIEDPETSDNPNGNVRERHFPMVLGPGEDSVGVFGALARVPLNIGVFSEEWMRTGNLILGYTPQRPFRIAVNRANSVFWNVNEKYRVPYMAKFFELGASGNVAKSTAPMRLKYAQEVLRDSQRNPILDGAGKPSRELLGKKVLDQEATADPTLVARGREAFLNNCAICHSSKQPKGYDLRFEREMASGWDNAPVPTGKNALIYTLPMEYRNWEDYKKSPSYKDYLAHLRAMPEVAATPAPGDEDPFITNNFLSNELRIPITLTGTYSGRAMATNAMANHVWDNYSSRTFKDLKSVGNIRYFNPYHPNAAAVKLDPFGTNDEYNDGRIKGGPGYFRPATLISIWATAPFFHNNALGIYTHDTSVKGRLIGFDDAIRKLLWNAQRPRYERDYEGEKVTYVPPGDLRPDGSAAATNDPGYIYRLPVDTYVQFQPGFIPLIINGLLNGLFGPSLGGIVFCFLTFWLWVILVVLLAVLAIRAKARHAGVFLLLLALILAVALAFSGATGYGGTVVGALMMGMAGMLQYSSVWLWCIVGVLGIGGFILSMAREDKKGPVRVLVRAMFFVIALAVLFVGILTNKFLNGRLPDVNPLIAVLPNKLLNAPYKGISVGPIPRGTPVNLIMNLDPEKRAQSAQALVALVRAIGEIKQQGLTGEAAYQVLAKRAGPALIAASKVPDMVLDRGHWFGEFLTDKDKEALIAFLKTL